MSSNQPKPQSYKIVNFILLYLVSYPLTLYVLFYQDIIKMYPNLIFEYFNNLESYHKTLNMMTYFFLGVVSVSSIMDLLTTITINKTKELIPSEEKNIKTNILKNSTLNKVSNIIKTCFNGALFFTWGFFVKHSLLMTFSTMMILYSFYIKNKISKLELNNN
jgi:hypothetical protein